MYTEALYRTLLFTYVKYDEAWAKFCATENPRAALSSGGNTALFANTRQQVTPDTQNRLRCNILAKVRPLMVPN